MDKNQLINSLSKTGSMQQAMDLFFNVKQDIYDFTKNDIKEIRNRWLL